MKKALMRSNTRLLLTAVMLLQALTMAVIAFRGGGAPSAQALALAVYTVPFSSMSTLAAVASQ